MTVEVTLTLSDALHRVSDWDTFCAEKGISVWAVKEGYGHTTVTLTEQEANKYKIFNPPKKSIHL